MRARHARLLGLTGLLIALVACSGGGDDPTVLPSASTQPPTTTSSPSTSSPTTAVTTSAEPTPTTTLLLPDEHIEDVDAFVREFFEAIETVKTTKDFTTFDAMYLPQCSGCAQLRSELSDWLAAGAKVEGAEWVIIQQSSAQFLDSVDVSVLAWRTAGVAVGGQIDQLPVQIFNIAIRQGSTMPWTVMDLAFSAAQ